MDQNNPRPAQRQNNDLRQNQVQPQNSFMDRIRNNNIRDTNLQVGGAITYESVFPDSMRRSGNEFRSLMTEASAHMARSDLGGVNARRVVPDDGMTSVQSSGQTSREGMDRPGRQITVPASLREGDYATANRTVSRRLDERGRDNSRGEN